MRLLLARPPQLVLVPNETHGECDRLVEEEVPIQRCIAVQVSERNP
jgi:hypothetical protein